MFIRCSHGFAFQYFIFLLILGLNIDFYTNSSFKLKPCNFSFVQSVKISKIFLNGSIFNSTKNYSSNVNYFTYTLSPLERLNSNHFKTSMTKYSFVPYNKLSTYKAHKILKYDKIYNIASSQLDNTSIESELPLSRSSIHLFKTLKNFFCNEFRGWYVPPIPIGERMSYRLRGNEPLQSEEETKEFLKLVGADEDDDIYMVMAKYKDTFKTAPTYMRQNLTILGEEYLRKYFVGVLEEIEDAASRGTEAWREFWKPEKDQHGNFIVPDSPELTKLDMEFASWFAPEVRAEELIREGKRRSMSFLNIDTNRYVGLIRLTRNPKERLFKCLRTMLPVMVAGLLPKLGKLSITVSSMIACRIIYKGDEKEKSDEKWEPRRYVTPNDLDRSETSKSLATLAVVAGHSAVGYLIASIVGKFANLGSTLVSDAIYSFFINAQLILSAILYDTSQMSLKEVLESDKIRAKGPKQKTKID